MMGRIEIYNSNRNIFTELMECEKVGVKKSFEIPKWRGLLSSLVGLSTYEKALKLSFG